MVRMEHKSNKLESYNVNHTSKEPFATVEAHDERNQTDLTNYRKSFGPHKQNLAMISHAYSTRSMHATNAEHKVLPMLNATGVPYTHTKKFRYVRENTDYKAISSYLKHIRNDLPLSQEEDLVYYNDFWKDKALMNYKYTYSPEKQLYCAFANNEQYCNCQPNEHLAGTSRSRASRNLLEDTEEVDVKDYNRRVKGNNRSILEGYKSIESTPFLETIYNGYILEPIINGTENLSKTTCIITNLFSQSSYKDLEIVFNKDFSLKYNFLFLGNDRRRQNTSCYAVINFTAVQYLDQFCCEFTNIKEIAQSDIRIFYTNVQGLEDVGLYIKYHEILQEDICRWPKLYFTSGKNKGREIDYLSIC